MKKIYFLFCFVFSFGAIAQIVNIPDANFKAKLLEASISNTIAGICNGTGPCQGGMVGIDYISIDTNNDGEIQLAEAQMVEYLKIEYSNINDLTGIESFTNLKKLFVSNNNLLNVDVSMLSNLIEFRCENNSITNLNISGCSNLNYLWCSNSQLSNLDVSSNLNLMHIYCSDNQLTNIDVSMLPNLEVLFCNNNQLTTLDLSQNTNLWALWCHFNQLEYINIKNGNTSGVFWSEFFIENNPNLHFICANEEDIGWVQHQIDSYGYHLTCHVNSYCSFTPGGAFYEITGNTKFDLNNNGCDVTDINYSNLKLGITNGSNSGIVISNTNGDYYIPVLAGNHTVTPFLENPSYFNISPSNFTVDFPTQSSPFTQDFCVTANGVHSDVEVWISPITIAQPGYVAKYLISYWNKGNQVENGTVELTFGDAVLDYVSSNPVYNSSTANSLTWNYTNLQPFETRAIEVSFHLNSPVESPAVNIDDILNYFVTISTSNTDETPNDNSFTLNQTVVGPYDPNDKICLEGETVDIAMVGEYVHYVIRFENTGTYPAQNIVVKDMIDTSKFDVSTLVPLHGSHEFYTRIKDNKVEFIFENINLDFNDATNDGYVAFKIKTLPSLTVGDTFTNDANIYFDYNFPITTNTYTTTINNVLNNQDFTFENEFVLYPNPTQSVINISSKNETEIQSVEIYNIVGQVVLAIPNTTKTIDVSNLENGTYFVKVNTQQGITTTKFVKE